MTSFSFDNQAKTLLYEGFKKKGRPGWHYAKLHFKTVTLQNSLQTFSQCCSLNDFWFIFPISSYFCLYSYETITKGINLFYSWNTQLTWSVVEVIITAIIILGTGITLTTTTTVTVTAPGTLLKSSGVIKMLTIRLGPV